jgi:hypothetical protein
VDKASKFSLVVFAPVLAAFLLPALFLLPAGILLTLLAVFDSAGSFLGISGYDLWIIAPVAAACILFLAGRGLFFFHHRGWSPSAAWTVTWVVFSTVLFLAFWFGMTVLSSIGASDKPMHIFLAWTAIFAAGLIGMAQLLVIPWLYIVSKVLHNDLTPEPVETPHPTTVEPVKE